MFVRYLLTLALLCATVAPAFAGPIENLRAGEWYMVPNSRLDAVFPSPLPPGNTGPDAVVSKWSGAVYDSQRDRLVVWGGGHWDYSGNEIYVFRLNSENGDPALTWKRITNPSSDVSGQGPYYNDGKPRSRHTYNYIEYIPAPFDRLCTFGGTSLYPGTVTPNTDCFNFGTSQWTQYANSPSYGEGAPAAYDPVTGHVWQQGMAPSPGKLAEYNPATNSWTTRGDYVSSLQYGYTAVGVIDPVRRKFMIFGGGIAASYNIGGSGILPVTNLATTGDNSIQASDVMGASYDSADDCIVAWNGGADVYVLNLNTLVWTRRSPAPTNTVVPTAPPGAGTYGRFRYVASRNAFMVVNATNQNVYFYKLSAGGGTPPDSIPPANTSDLRTR